VTTYLGIDVGTSAIKAVLVDERQAVLAESSVPLSISRPKALWSEQEPETWWNAVEEAVATLRNQARGRFASVLGIGLSGQMHGAVVLGDRDRPLCPAILWNDGRSFREAAELEKRHPQLSQVTGVLPMPGFTAPKLLWLARHQPEVFEAARTIMLPKDYVRLKLTGQKVTEMSDAAGTWWLDEAHRDWSDDALAATGLDRSRMPLLCEGSDPSGTLRPEIAQAWGLSNRTIVAGGAGDAAAGAVGLGAVDQGSAFLSLGTSGQLFVTTSQFLAAPETLVHAFCHAVPGRWFQMAAMLNAASCLAWTAEILGGEIANLLRETEGRFDQPASCLFLPYLMGERTPHNDPHARGVFFGMTPEVGRAELVQSVLEGVAFSFADARECLENAGTAISRASVIGGGSRSRLWARILASVLNIPLTRYAGSEKGPAFGAARLARLAVTGEALEMVCTAPPVQDVVAPDPRLVEAYRPRIEAFRRVYRALKPEFELDSHV
jgi:xylulokinase